MNTSANNYFLEGCGRCSLGGTPACKVHHWFDVLEVLRGLILESELVEDCKWGVPCYTLEGKNVLMLSAFKQFACISFFKGTLLRDEQQLLEKAGPNSQITRLLKFTNIEAIAKNEEYIRAYIKEAIALEKSGAKVTVPEQSTPIPIEFEEILEANPALKTAFEALTAGRQRGYLLYFSQPKQSKTRLSRIEKCTPMILAGVGLHDNYKKKK